uniref:Nonsense-mediated mRNA decay factor SMG8 n=1 Tax=Caenorhabditis japonica TaxID=281687 RepID=A0A8R1DND5_CAEJA
MEIGDWILKARDLYSTQLDAKIKVVGVIGRDTPDHGKGDNINCYIRENVFPVASTQDETCTIRAHYSEDDQILFLVMNGVDDAANIRKFLKNDHQNYFEALAQSELQQIRMLHFLFISCHFILIFEQTSRIDLELLRFLRRANSARLQLRRKVNRKLVTAGLTEIPFSNRAMSELEGRVVIPRILIAFQRNNIRADVNPQKKRELYEKLEKHLDSQFNELLKTYELIDSGTSTLCHLHDTIPCVHLMNPRTVKRDIVCEMFDAVMMDAENRGVGSVQGLSSNNSFVMFLEENFRSEENEASLEHVIHLMDALLCILDGSIEDDGSEVYKSMSTLMRNFQKVQLEQAIRLYTNQYGRPMDRRGGVREEAEPMRIRSKEEHTAKFNEATQYIKSVVANNTEDVLAKLQARCDEMWQSDMRACETMSLMGRACVKKFHPSFGDQSVPEAKWQAHDAANTLVSTCVCGRKQAIRQEPFSVKEANFDFYDNNVEFKCCRRLWRYQFQLYQEDSEEKEDSIMWADRESNSLYAGAKKVRREEDDEDLEVAPLTDSLMEDDDSEEDVRVRTQSSSSSTCSDDDMYIRPSSSRRDDSNASKTEHDLCVEYAKRLQKLEAAEKNNEFIVDVPNSLNTGKLPLFPSWFLTSLGDSSLYGHGKGLKNQPNFKIGGEYLTPVVVLLPVDADTFNRDLIKFRNDEFGSRRIVSSGKDGDDSARVKLFVGFEYECSRGHRFFVDHNGEPLIYPKGSNVVRESAQRSALGDVLHSDLPIRRPCTCRKKPLKSAQLQKIHVVTPKAPVQISVNPQILIPGHEGVYGIGQNPLELHHSKYYILHLPAVYSGPSGTWIPEEYSPEKKGVWKGGAIKVTYKPVYSFHW